MHIVSVQKTSLLDYPGKISCIVFTAGCNFRCRFCHNPECVLPEQIVKMPKVDIDSFLTRLQTRQGLLDGVSICGGEPTLQSDLFTFIQNIKQLGFLVKLDTNGRDSDILQKLINAELVDYVAIDAKFPIGRLKEVVNVDIDDNFTSNYKKCLGILKSSDIDYEYRTTIIKNYHDVDIIAQICKELGDIHSYYIQNFINTKTIETDFNGGSFSKDEVIEFVNIAKKYIPNTQYRM